MGRSAHQHPQHNYALEKFRGKKNVEKLTRYSFFLWAFDEDLFSLSCIYLGQANDSTNCDQHKQSKIKNKILKKNIIFKSF